MLEHHVLHESFGWLVLLLNLLLVPLIVYCAYILHQNKNSLYFQKRGIAFLIVHLVVSFLNHGILYPTGTLRVFFDIRLEIDDRQTITKLNRFLTICFTLAIFLNIVFRLFYQFIQIQRSKHTLILIKIPEIQLNNKSSTIAIATDEKNESMTKKHNCNYNDNNEFGKLSFILNNYHIFGNPTVICWIGICVWLLISIAFVPATYNLVQNDTQRLLIHSIIFTVTLIGMIVPVIYLAKMQRIFKFKDHWDITIEFQRYGRILLVAGVYCMCMYTDDAMFSDP